MNGGTSTRTAPVVTVASVCVAVLALWASREFLVPLVFSALVSWVLLPLVLDLERRGLSRIFAVLLVCAVTYGGMAAVTWIAARQMVEVAEIASSSRHQLKAKLADIGLARVQHLAESIDDAGHSPPTAANRDPVAEPPNSPAPSDIAPTSAPTQPPPVSNPASSEPVPPSKPDPLPVRIVDPTSSVELLSAIATRVLKPLAVAGFAAIVGVFVILRWEDVRDRFIRLVSHGRIALTTKALDDLSSSVSAVLRAQVLLNIGTGAAIGVGLWAMDVPRALLWGLIAALFRFVPLVGPIAAAVFPAILTLATTDGWTLPALILALYLVIELVVANAIEPAVLGSRAGVSTVALLVAAAFWTWIWGLPGLLLATPITVGLAVIGRHVPQLAFLDVLLGERPVLTPAARLYQRVAALDRVEVTRLVKEAETKVGPHGVINELLTPVLHASETARQDGEIDDARAQAMFALLGDVVDGVRERIEGLAKPTRTDANVLCIPAAGDADEVAASLLAALCVRAGVQARALALAELGDLPMLLGEQSAKPLAACICSVSPLSGRAARIRSRQIDLRRPGTSIVTIELDPHRDGLAPLTDPASTPDPRPPTSLESAAERLAASVDEPSHVVGRSDG